MTVRTYRLRIVAALWAGLIAAAALTAAPVAHAAPTLAAEEATRTADRMVSWIIRADDNDGLPFAIIDKAAGMVFVYDARGKLLGADAALTGFAFGDDSVEGIGDRQLSNIAPEERTTPAGRFVGGYGPALGYEEDVLWVDNATAVSLHPVVTTNPDEMRPQRLKSASPYDNRISFGCINVEPEFYEEVVQPAFTGTRGVFYVLPDTKTMAEVFPAFAATAHAEAEPDDEVSPEPTGWLRRLWPW